MRKNIALIVMCVGVLLFGCSNQENPSDDRLENEKVETTAPVIETAEPTAPADETAAPVETVAPTEPAKTDEPTTEPTEVPTVEPTVEPTTEPTVKPTVEPTKQPTKAPVVTKAPTKAPVVTKAPTKKPVVTKAPTKAPATKQPTTTKNPNAAGKPYKVGNVTVTPVKGVTMWSRNHGLVRTKPWTSNSLNWGDYDFNWKNVTEKNSVILAHQYYSEIDVTGICSNGFIQYYINNSEYKGYVYTHKDQLYTEKPIEFTYKGYDPVEDVIKPALEKLKKKGFHLYTDDADDTIEWMKENIEADKKILKSIEDGTFDFLTVNCWTEEEEEEYEKMIRQSIKDGEKAIKEYEQYMKVDIYKYEAIENPYAEIGNFEGITFNCNLNRLHVSPSVIADGCENLDDIVDCIVRQFEFNREHNTARADYVWIYYGVIEDIGSAKETCYEFYLTGLQ